MALDPRFSQARRHEMLDAIAPNFNSGLVRIYDGSKPATADTAVSSQTLLAELTMNASAFGAASSGTITAAAITADSSANATGTASWFRVVESDGTTIICDGTVGTSTSDMVINTTSIVSGATVSIASYTISMAA